MHISLSGDGAEVIFCEISSFAFYNILSRIFKYSPDKILQLLEYELTWSYSNSNPIIPNYDLFADGEKIDVNPGFAADSEKITLAEPGCFYIASLADAEHEDWFSTESDGDLDLSKLEISRCQVSFSPEGPSLDFVDAVRCGDVDFEGRDASRVYEPGYFLVDHRGRTYILSGDKSYTSAWEGDELDAISDSNIEYFLSSGSLEPRHKNTALAAIGFRCWQRGQIERAKACLEDVDFFEYDEGCDWIICMALWAQGVIALLDESAPDITEAISIFNKALDTPYSSENPDYRAKVLIERASALALTGKPALAINDHKAIITILEELKEDPSLLDSQGKGFYKSVDSVNHDLAACKINLAMLRKKFGGEYISLLAEGIDLCPSQSIRDLVYVKQIEQVDLQSALALGTCSPQSLSEAILALAYLPGQ